MRMGMGLGMGLDGRGRAQFDAVDPEQAVEKRRPVGPALGRPGPGRVAIGRLSGVFDRMRPGFLL